MKKILICQHGGSSNHGCEALARTTAALIAQLPEPCQITLYSYRVDDDRKYLSDLPDLRITGLQRLPGRFSMHNISYHMKKRLGRSASRLPITPEFIRLVRESDLVIAIGGDNYCYNRGEGYYALDRFIRAQGKPYMLLGCSIEPDDLPRGLAAHLQLFDAITARESITYEALCENGVINALPAHDGAFLLPAVEEALPDGFQEGNTVGINLSPLIQRLEGKPGITLENYRRLVRHILDTTDMAVALIPHVVWGEGDDRLPLRQLFDEFSGTGRVVMVPDADCRVLKGVIARLRFFVGARTHATIAAYSSLVPTLVVGYSVKARGIARDLFGSVEHYVLPVQSLKTPDDLTEAFDWVAAHEDEMRDRLRETMPAYCENSRDTGKSIARLLGLCGGEGLAGGIERPGSCVGCGACAWRCPAGAITMQPDCEGFTRPAVDKEKCTGCGACRAVCPAGQTAKTGETPQTFCAYSRDEQARQKSSSGGVFTELAHQVLEKDGVVVGAAWDKGGVLRHTAVDSVGALSALRGAKYVQSDASAAWPAIDQALKEKRPVLFCGTPCQTAAVRRAFGSPAELLLVDIVCHGVPSPASLRQYLDELSEQQGEQVAAIDFRDKSTGWKGYSVTARLRKGGKVSRPAAADPYMKLFLADVGLRPSCYQCGIRGKASQSDLTLGDFWGANRLFAGKDDDKGLSLVLVHTEVGRRAWEDLRESVVFWQADFDAAAGYNPCLVRPVVRPQNRGRFFAQLGKKPMETLAQELSPQPSNAQRVKAKLRRVLKR